MSKPTFTWKEEQAAQGEVQPPLAKEVLDAMARSNDEILKDYPASKMVAEIQRRAQGQRAQAWWRTVSVVGGLAAAACAVVLVTTISVHTPETAPHELTKGDNVGHLRIYRLGQNSPEVVGDGQTQAHAGDKLRVSYFGATTPEGVIVSIDGRGGVTLHWPLSENASTALPAREQTLPNAFELDDAPGFERFFFVTGKDVSVAEVVGAARTLAQTGNGKDGMLGLRAGLEQSSVRVDKTPQGQTP